MVLIDMCWGQPWMSKDVLEQMGHLGPGTGWWCSQTMLRTNLDIQVSPRTDGPQGIVIWESHHNNNSRHLGRPWYSLWTYCHSLLLWIFKVVPDHFKIQDVPERSLRLYNFEEGTSPPPPPLSDSCPRFMDFSCTLKAVNWLGESSQKKRLRSLGCSWLCGQSQVYGYTHVHHFWLVASLVQEAECTRRS